MKLKEFFREEYEPRRLRGSNGCTARLYGFTIASFGRFLERPATLDDLNDKAVLRFLTARGGEVSRYTVEKERSQLLALWRLAFHLGMVNRWPDVPPSKLPRRNPEALTIDEVRRLVTAADELAPAWGTLVRVAYETGERIAAILALTPRDIRGRRILFRAETRKFGVADNLATVTPETAARLAALIELGNPKVFPMKDVHYWWHVIIGKAGIHPRARRCGWHMLRRTAASHLKAAGGDPQKLLGHASPVTTVRWYLDKTITDTGPPPCDLLPSVG